jgi:hypothetical protein
MATIQEGLVYAALTKAFAKKDINIETPDQQHEFRKNIILTDESLTEDEKSEAIRILTKNMDYYKLLENKGTKRICEDCQKECLATLFCEHCVRNYLKVKFSNWTSGNNDIDNLIQKCQLETLTPNKIVEWIPHENLQNIKYLKKGGFSKVYTADWIDGAYKEWDNKEKQLKRFGKKKVALKKLKNVENANKRWFEEVRYLFEITVFGKSFCIIVHPFNNFFFRANLI